MTRASAGQVQRLLASEFDRHGWEYDLTAGRSIAEEVLRSSRVDPSSLASIPNRDLLTRLRITRDDLAKAIERALRGLELGPPEAEDNGDPKMKILFVAAGPADEPRLRLDAEHRDVRSRVRSASRRADVLIETAFAARPTDLIDELNRFQPTVLHLAGHGGKTGIALEDDAGTAADVTTDQLVTLVVVAPRTLRLVVLNSCDSAHHAAPVTQHADAAIGMTRSIGDDAARVFAAQLYSSLAEGVDLRRSFDQARLQISLSGLPDDTTPKLFVRTGMDAARIVLVKR